jgi:hypothetical protein
VFPGNHKSGALLIRDSPPHYLISGAGKIFIAQSNSLLNWTLGKPFIHETLWGNPNVEAGPPPMRLSVSHRPVPSVLLVAGIRLVVHKCEQTLREFVHKCEVNRKCEQLTHKSQVSVNLSHFVHK